MMSVDQEFVVVTPVYEDNEASAKLFHELYKEFGTRVRIVAVDDGSVREPLDRNSISDAGLSGVVIRLKRNLGHQQAIAVGLCYVAEEFPDTPVVVMDSDGEDLPSTISTLLEPLQEPDIDMVVAERQSRVETLRFRAFYAIYKRIFKFLSGRKISFGNFMALNPAGVKRLANMQELWTHVAGCALASKLRISNRPLDRGPRYAGQSKMNFVGLALHGFRALMVFAEDVLVRVGIACAGIASFSIVAGVVAVLLKLFGFATPGWFSVALGILLIVFLQTGALALMTLMLSGVARGGVSVTDYRMLLDSVEKVGPDASA
jgi:glycosyltransferase involved in cell wall biosynthesis